MDYRHVRFSVQYIQHFGPLLRVTCYTLFVFDHIRFELIFSYWKSADHWIALMFVQINEWLSENTRCTWATFIIWIFRIIVNDDSICMVNNMVSHSSRSVIFTNRYRWNWNVCIGMQCDRRPSYAYYYYYWSSSISD